MRLRVRLESSVADFQHKSGVPQYTSSLLRALESNNDVHLESFHPFGHNLLLYRIYTKINSYAVSLPADIFSSPVDLTIFPNFATWPTVRSKLRAAVVHDLTYVYHPEVVEAKNLAHLRRVVPRSIKQADFIITVSESVKAELIKEFNLDPERCVVTPIPPAAEFYQKSDNDIHKKYKIPTEKYIYFIGTLEPRKNLSTLLKAYLQLPDAIRKEYSLILGGSKGWKNEALQESLRKAEESGENVRHIGFVDQADSPALYQKADVFVMPSLYEGFGIPILESMASGTPVVASNIPVLREVGGDAAIYASPDSVSDFRDKILAALKFTTSPEWRARAKENAARFSWEDNTDKIIATTNSLLA